MNKYVNWATQFLDCDCGVEKETYGDQSDVYKLITPGQHYFLKVASVLEKERVRLEWLAGKLPVPRVIALSRIEDKDALLMTEVEGENLARLCQKISPQDTVSKLAHAIRDVHSIDISSCPFGKKGDGKVLVHGDACLPNFIYRGGELSGYIDLDDMQVADKNVDLAAAVWSLQYNLGKGYGLAFLKEYGVKDATENLVNKLYDLYED
ncbi:MAG: phosphotransferase [Bacteroidota bacterium]